ncbi:MAG: hypothetical protein PHE08_05670, partial [Bacteroidales bacterium]|nr:hypothetical protein [Bacteroidales bacterium]
MKRYFTFLVFSIITLSLSAQDIVIKDITDEIINGQTIQVAVDVNIINTPAILSLIIQNQSTNSLDLKVK